MSYRMTTMSDKPKCGANLKAKGKKCARPAGWGTPHPGTGACKLHGGSTPNGNKSALVKQHEAAMAAGPIPGVPISPEDFIVQAITYHNGEVEWCTAKLAELHDSDILVDTMFGPQIHALVDIRARSLKYGMDAAKTALSLGLEERKVKVQEQLAMLVAGAVRGLLDELQLTPDQQAAAKEAIPKHMKQLALPPGKEQG